MVLYDKLEMINGLNGILNMYLQQFFFFTKMYAIWLKSEFQFSWN